MKLKRAGWSAALLLLVVVNVMVLAGVAWNRSGEPEATLQLTERELPLQYRWVRSQENTGVAFNLNIAEDSYSPHWLDEDKLRALGFAVPESASERADYDEGLKNPVSRQAWVVLEFDGPAWQALLADQERRLADRRLAVASGEATRAHIEDLEKALTRMRQSGSRLVAVDADPDAALLRARYPDRGRHLITGARVRMWVGRSQETEDDSGALLVKGHLHVLVDRIHVPLQHRGTLQSIVGGDLLDGRMPAAGQPPRYSVQLHYGRRYEPWVEEIAALGRQ